MDAHPPIRRRRAPRLSRRLVGIGNVVTAVLVRFRVLEVQANPVAQTATVVFDPAVTSLAQLRRLDT